MAAGQSSHPPLVLSVAIRRNHSKQSLAPHHNELGPGPGKRDVHPLGHHQEPLLGLDMFFIRAVDEREDLASPTS